MTINIFDEREVRARLAEAKEQLDKLVAEQKRVAPEADVLAKALSLHNQLRALEHQLCVSRDQDSRFADLDAFRTVYGELCSWDFMIHVSPTTLGNYDNSHDPELLVKRATALDLAKSFTVPVGGLPDDDGYLRKIAEALARIQLSIPCGYYIEADRREIRVYRESDRAIVADFGFPRQLASAPVSSEWRSSFDPPPEGGIDLYDAIRQVENRNTEASEAE